MVKKKQDLGKKKVLLSDTLSEKIPIAKYFMMRFPWVIQFINFSMVGVINMVLSYLIYAFFIYINFHHQIANQLAIWISVLNGYILNKSWVFKNQSQEKSKSQMIKYFLVYGVNMFLGMFLLYIYIDILNLNKYVAPFISIPITIPMNYALNKYLVFKKNDD